MITLKLYAKYFKDAEYENNKKCAGALAAKDQLGLSDDEVRFGSSQVYTDDVGYDISGGNCELGEPGYGGRDFDEDSKKAEQAGYDDTIIRTLVLTPRTNVI